MKLEEEDRRSNPKRRVPIGLLIWAAGTVIAVVGFVALYLTSVQRRPLEASPPATAPASVAPSSVAR